MSAATEIIVKPHSDSDLLCGSSPTDHVIVDRSQFNPELDKVVKKLDGEEHIFFQTSQGFEHDDGRIFLTNFRCYSLRNSRCITVNIPLGLIESVEYRDLTTVLIHCKDGRVFRFTFSNNSLAAQDLVKAVNEATESPMEIDNTFASKYKESIKASNFNHGLGNGSENTQLSKCNGSDSAADRYELYEQQLAEEMKRMGFPDSLWQIDEVNKDFRICATYPQVHILPAKVFDSADQSTDGPKGCIQKLVKEAALFRAEGRFPSVVWRHRTSGAVLIRSSQPQSGLFNRRSNADEELLKSIARAAALCNCPSTQPDGLNGMSNGKNSASNGIKNPAEGRLLVIDARSYKAAFGNWMKGGGVESQENYGSELIYMNIENIHQVRKSLQSLRSLFATSKMTGDVGFYTNLDSTQWLNHLSTLLSSAYRVSRELSSGRSVLVHCSDGWDRTPQIVSLAELILDPYYRTLKGFQILVDREWLCFGHKFADRCGNPPNISDPNERSPIFLQWLDCVYQLTCQNPTAFEFTETFLLKLLVHVYSNLYGTFMCNSLQDRNTNQISMKATSVWPALINNERSKNLLFDEKNKKPLRVAYIVSHLQIWRRAYMTREFNVGSPSTACCTGTNNSTSSNGNSNGNDRESPSGTVSFINGNGESKTAAIAIPKQSSPAASRNGQKFDAFSFEGKSPIMPNLSSSTDSVLIVAPPPRNSPSPQGLFYTASSSPLKNGLANGLAFISGFAGSSAANPPPKEADFSHVERCEDDQLAESDDEFRIGEDTLPTYVDPVQEKARELKKALDTMQQQLSINQVGCPDNGNLSITTRSAHGNRGCSQLRLSESSPDVTGYDYVQPDVRAEVPASWLPNDLFPYCSACKKEFSYFRGRHHCRNCGHVFCDGCSNLRAVVPPVSSGQVRVCQSCYRNLNSIPSAANTVKSMFASFPPTTSPSTNIAGSSS